MEIIANPARHQFPGLPTDPDNPIARAIAKMEPAAAYEAGFSDRKAGAPSRSDGPFRDLDYDLGWRDAAPGGHGHRDATPTVPLCADCGQPFRQEPSGCAGHGCQQPVPDHDRKVRLGFLADCAAAACAHAT